MISKYHRPNSMKEVFELIKRENITTIPLGGGTVVSRQFFGNSAIEVVDLQNLGMNKIQKKEGTLNIGATVTLRQLIDHSDVSEEIKEAVSRETTYNIRQMATVGGALICGDGRSPLLTSLLALDCYTAWEPNNQTISLGNWLPVRLLPNPGKVLVNISYSFDIKLKLIILSKTPADVPHGVIAIAKWDKGRTRIAVGLDKSIPALLIDGLDIPDTEKMSEYACSHFGINKHNFLFHNIKTVFTRLLN